MKVTFDEYPDDDRDIHNKKKIENDKNDTIIFYVVLFLFCSRLFWSIIPKFLDAYFNPDWYHPIGILISFLWAIIPISLSFTIKDSSKRKTIFTLGILYLLEGLYQTATTM